MVRSKSLFVFKIFSMANHAWEREREREREREIERERIVDISKEFCCAVPTGNFAVPVISVYTLSGTTDNLNMTNALKLLSTMF